MKNLPLIFLVAMLISACSSSKIVYDRNDKHFFDYVGHRGARGLLPENTIPSFIKAIDLGVTTLEMDAVVTKDNVVILSHEPYFNTEITTLPNGKFIDEGKGPTYNIYRMTYDEVKKYDVGLKAHSVFNRQEKIAVHKPALAEVIDSVEAYLAAKNHPKLYYNIEIKSKEGFDNTYHPAPDKFVDLVMKVVNEKGISDRVIIQSFDFRSLQALHNKYPKVATSLLIEKEDNRSLRKQLHDLGFFPNIYSPAHELVKKNLVKELKKDNIKLVPWTINNLDRMKELKKIGVDGIISDYPDLFEKLRN